MCQLFKIINGIKTKFYSIAFTILFLYHLKTTDNRFVKEIFYNKKSQRFPEVIFDE